MLFELRYCLALSKGFSLGLGYAASILVLFALVQGHPRMVRGDLLSESDSRDEHVTWRLCKDPYLT